MKRIITYIFLLTICNITIYAQETGTASFYNKKFHGRKTTSGERFDNKLYTAAHKSLPIGTRVKVTNLANDKSVIVKVNDRGYFKHGRVIDITYGAAKEIDMIRYGIVKVKLEVLPPEEILISDSTAMISTTENIK